MTRKESGWIDPNISSLSCLGYRTQNMIDEYRNQQKGKQIICEGVF